MFCREEVVQLHRESDRFRASGVEVVIVGSGGPSFIAGFREATGFPGRVLADPTRKAYEAAQLKRGAWRTLKPTVALRALKTLARGFRQGSTQGDPWQQAGLLLIAPPARLVYYHASQEPGDYPPIGDILRAVESVAQS